MLKKAKTAFFLKPLFQAEKPLDYEQTKRLPINYKDQLIPGSFEYTLNSLVDSEMDLSVLNHAIRMRR